MNIEGWIAREIVIDPEQLAQCQWPTLIAQHDDYANPPAHS